jgi:hypothetical protein
MVWGMNEGESVVTPFVGLRCANPTYEAWANAGPSQYGAIAGDDNYVGFRITDTMDPDVAAGNINCDRLRFDAGLTNCSITITEFAIRTALARPG